MTSTPTPEPERPRCAQPLDHDGQHRGFPGSGFEGVQWGAPIMRDEDFARTYRPDPPHTPVDGDSGRWVYAEGHNRLEHIDGLTLDWMQVGSVKAFRDLAALLAPPSPVGEERRLDGAGLIAAERERQVTAEGWTPEHDDEHTIGELVDAAVCYLKHGLDAESPVIWPWPWAEDWWKPSDDPIRNLVRAGALIAAEIDRLTRAAADRGDRA